MFRSFRNFPRINDKSNVVTQPQINVFVADGINDTSKGVWISPTRTVTTEDGTLHIGLMNPFEGASVTTVVNTACDSAVPNSSSCVAACSACQCGTVFTQQNVIQANLGLAQWDNFACLYDTNQPSTGTGTCNMICQLSRSGGGPGGFANFPCAGEAQYTCGSGSGSTPPDVASAIIRAVERFVLEMDLSALSNVQASNINSAILRLPIKTKVDWM